MADLQRQFGTRRQELLQHRASGARPWPGHAAGLPARDRGRSGAGLWQVADAAADLLDRRVEITGPAEPKMLINALNSGAKVFMADIEDALSPTWANVLGAQTTLLDAVNREVDFTQRRGQALRPQRGDRHAAWCATAAGTSTRRT